MKTEKIITDKVCIKCGRLMEWRMLRPRKIDSERGILFCGNCLHSRKIFEIPERKKLQELNGSFILKAGKDNE